LHSASLSRPDIDMAQILGPLFYPLPSIANPIRSVGLALGHTAVRSLDATVRFAQHRACRRIGPERGATFETHIVRQVVALPEIFERVFFGTFIVLEIELSTKGWRVACIFRWALIGSSPAVTKPSGTPVAEPVIRRHKSSA